MWESDVSVGCVVMYILGTIGTMFIIGALFVDRNGLAGAGVATIVVACAMAVIRDNQRTRRMLRRPDERLTPMR